MLFSSIPFLFYFLPVVLILYFLAPNKLKNSVLLLSSLFFYGWGEPIYLFLMIATIIVFYFCGMFIGKSESQKVKKIWLIISIISSISVLCVFKYADFFIDSFNSITGLSIPLLKIALPIGISFYTFQCLSYTIDVYKGDVEYQKDIISFGAYVVLFPQLIAGPIVRYSDVAMELNDRVHSFDKFTIGIRRFIIGLSKKVLIANQLGEFVNIFRTMDEPSIIMHWLYALAFSLHIYFDFSGYSDMAIGLGKIFGFNFIENFNYPYTSKSVSEFWRRWHMSLGSWFRDYVYIPLGGNRVSKSRWVFNVLVVWMLTGLWHGASWNFVLWGLLFAIALLMEKFLPGLQKMPNIFKRCYTLGVVMIGFILFNATDLSQACSDFYNMFNINGLPFINSEAYYYFKSYFVVFTVAIIGATPFMKNTVEKWYSRKVWGDIVTFLEPVVVLILLVVCSAYLIDGSFNPFLYFRF